MPRDPGGRFHCPGVRNPTLPSSTSWLSTAPWKLAIFGFENDQLEWKFAQIKRMHAFNRVSPFLHPMQIPHQELEPSILRKVIEEFVTRDGTDISSVEARVEAVLKQLRNGRAELHFDDETKTTNILSRERP